MKKIVVDIKDFKTILEILQVSLYKQGEFEQMKYIVDKPNVKNIPIGATIWYHTKEIPEELMRAKGIEKFLIPPGATTDPINYKLRTI